MKNRKIAIVGIGLHPWCVFKGKSMAEMGVVAISNALADAHMKWRDIQTMACGAFAAICGSSDASAAAMGKVAYPEMVKFKYDKRLASACIAAGGSIGIMIPPSLGFIFTACLPNNP